MTRPHDLFVAKDPIAEQEYREKQSADLLQLLNARVARLQQAMPDSATEALVNDVGDYLIGWLDAVVRTAPDLTSELSQEIETKICDGGASEAQSMLMFRAATLMPELATERSFDCFLSKTKGQENVATWQALDAWRASGLPETKAIEEFRKSARTPQSLTRLRADLDPAKQGAEPEEANSESGAAATFREPRVQEPLAALPSSVEFVSTRAPGRASREETPELAQEGEKR